MGAVSWQELHLPYNRYEKQEYIARLLWQPGKSPVFLNTTKCPNGVDWPLSS